MKRVVVDASVAIKWYLPEPHDDAALRLMNPDWELLVPDLFFPEIGNILWKRIIREEISPEKAFTILAALDTVPFQISEARSLLPAAFDIACRTQRTVYDSMYLAMAVNEECRMATADLKFYNSIKKGPLKKSVLWVEDIP